jgi:RND family efflux transporter MFP subunit
MKRFLVLSSLVGMAACGAEEPGRIPRAQDPIEVTVSAVVRAPTVESFPAVVTSERTAEVATRMSGTVERVLVDVGARVRAGDILIALDAKDIGARVAAAGAQRQLAERSFTRVDNLHRDGAASQSELDQASAGLEAARAMAAEAEAQEAYAVVRAPFAGVITQRSVDPGDLALPGRPLLSMMAPGALKIVAELPAQRAGSVAAGDVVGVRVGDHVHAGHVSRVVPALGEGSRTFRLEASLDAPGEDLVPGSYARLELGVAGEGPRWVPADAIVHRGQLTGVFTVEADTVRLRWVRLGQTRDDAAELLAAPAGDLTIVRRPGADLFDGRPVSTAREEPWTASGVEVGR